MPDFYPALRNRRSNELARLAEEHLQHDLRAEDRDALTTATQKVAWWTTIGSAVGLGLGLYAAFRLRSSRKAFFEVFRAREKPTHVVFAGGRSGRFIESSAPPAQMLYANPVANQSRFQISLHC